MKPSVLIIVVMVMVMVVVVVVAILFYLLPTQMFAVSGIIPTLAPADYNETVATNAAAFAAATREAPPAAAPAAPASASSSALLFSASPIRSHTNSDERSASPSLTTLSFWLPPKSAQRSIGVLCGGICGI